MTDTKHDESSATNPPATRTEAGVIYLPVAFLCYLRRVKGTVDERRSRHIHNRKEKRDEEDCS